MQQLESDNFRRNELLRNAKLGFDKKNEKGGKHGEGELDEQ